MPDHNSYLVIEKKFLDVLPVSIKNKLLNGWQGPEALRAASKCVWVSGISFCQGAYYSDGGMYRKNMYSSQSMCIEYFDNVAYQNGRALRRGTEEYDLIKKAVDDRYAKVAENFLKQIIKIT